MTPAPTTPGADRSASAGDPRFFQRAGPHTLAAVVDAAVVDGEAAEAPPRRLMLHRIAPLAAATPGDVTFCLKNRKYRPALAATRAGAVIVHPDMKDGVPETAVAILVSDPLVAWAKVAALFHPMPAIRPGVHPTAIVAASAKINPTTEVGPLAVIGENVVIGPRGRIGAMAVIGDGVEIGRDVRIGTHASVSHALVGDRVYVYPGARVGQEGFGFAITGEGFHTVPQLGRVLIEDDVEVGANSTIDRGTLEDTVIGAGSRIDNLVQIGHNVQTGRGCVIVAQAGVSGSTVLEDHVMLAGQAGIAGHLRIGAGSRIGAKAGVMADVPPRSDLAGSPAQPVKTFFKEIATIRRWIRNGGIPVQTTGSSETKNPDPD
ncbi:MAG: UDP-3-O-(3-hydroxymyristoyl)glucosamine N-acyltransferase [Rhodopila sp.]